MKSLSFPFHLLLCITAVCMIFTTGCSAVQVRDRAYLQAIELRHANQPSVSMHDFSMTGSVAEGTGESIPLAVTNAAECLGKDPFLGHLELIAYSDPLFTTELNKMMDVYRLSPACKVLGLPQNTTLDNTDTSTLVEQLRKQEQNGTLPETTIFTILRELASPSATALVPIASENNFSLAVISDNTILGTLSDDAVLGLCWLRGDNFPKQIDTGNMTIFNVQSAATRLSAVFSDNHAVITVSVYLRGDGNFQQAAQKIQMQCERAIAESVTNLHSDVFDWGACLQSQCYHDFVQTDWDELLESTEFKVQILPLQ